MTFMLNIWFIWFVISLFGVSVVGWKQKFVTTKLSGKRVTVVRIPKKYIRIGIWIATAVLAVLIIGETIYTYNASEVHDIDDLWLVILLIAIIIPFYHLALRIIFNQAREAHEVEMRAELKGE